MTAAGSGPGPDAPSSGATLDELSFTPATLQAPASTAAPTQTPDADAASTRPPGGTDGEVPTAPRSGAAGLPGLPPRYRLGARLGAGGHGAVWAATDTLLGRPVAIKALHPSLGASTVVRRSFLAEAHVTARLDHPGIVAVHDRGELSGGRLWFAMKRVEGETFRTVIAALHTRARTGSWDDTGEGWTLHRAVDVLARVADAVAYAHSKRILHRDLKPSNLMVGAFGAVYVMDWGLARLLDAAAPPPRSALPASGDGDGRHTRAGGALGTPAYMSPEQARGDLEALGPPSDVYSLGCVLFELLSGRAPFQGDALSILRQVLTGPVPRVEAAVARGHAPLPPALVALCDQATELRPDDRPPDAGAFGQALRDWLDGRARRARAMDRVQAARVLRPSITRQLDEARQLRSTSRQLLEGVRPHHPVARKLPAWTLEERADELELAAAKTEAALLRELHPALQHADLAEAHALLADHASERLLAAEAAGDRREVASYEALLRTHDRGRHRDLLRREGILSLHSDPPGAVVEAHRWVRRHRRLHLEAVGVLGRTPLRDLRLPLGSYRLTLRHPGRLAVHLPVLVQRRGTSTRPAPGATATAPVALPAAADAPADALWVAGGWCRVGGDPAAVDSLSARHVWLDPFWMQRHPVQNAEWLAFLRAESAAGRDVGPYVPGAVGTGQDGPAWHRDAAGRWQLPVEAADPQVPWAPDAPVLRISWHAAQAYAAWRARETGLPWRLPDELEWEAAARGVDGRAFPWGDHTDGTWANTADSLGDAPQVAAVHAFPVDESPWAVRGMGGGVQQWCSNGWTPDRPDAADGARVVPTTAGDPTLRIVRGGSWADAGDAARAAARRVGRPGTGYMRVGLRLVASAPPASPLRSRG